MTTTELLNSLPSPECKKLLEQYIAEGRKYGTCGVEECGPELLCSMTDEDAELLTSEEKEVVVALFSAANELGDLLDSILTDARHRARKGSK